MGQEKWDRCIVPKGRRKAVPTAATQGGKATTVSQQVVQLELFSETADSPQGDVAVADSGAPEPAASAVPKSPNTDSRVLPAMTMSEVASLSNLLAAFQQVAENRGAPGPDRQSVDDVRQHLDSTLVRIQKELLAGIYSPGLIRRVWIAKPDGGSRGLGIPDVIDRVVAQAIHQVMSPHYELTFHPSSHGFRPKRSCHTAISEACKYLDEGYSWLVDLDLEKFFDRVNHDRLMARVGLRVKDPLLLKIIRRMLKAKVILPNGVVVSTDEGTPQGGPLSPLLSNIVLDELDWELARRGHRFVRYADDVNIYVRSERAGRRVMSSVARFLQMRLRLSVNVRKSAVSNPAERHFLGFRLNRKAEDGTIEVLLSQRSEKRIRKRIRDLTPRNWGQSLDDCMQKLNVYLKGWLGFFSICTYERTFNTLDAHIRRRLRAIVLRHWKRGGTIVARLIKLGVRQQMARSIRRKGKIWAMSASFAVHKGLGNKFFAHRGLVSLLDQWRTAKVKAIIASKLEIAEVARPTLD